MRSGFRKKWDDLYSLVERKYRAYEYYNKAKIRKKNMNGGYNCTDEYNRIVVPYWAKYNQKPKKIWYELFSAESKKVDPRYIPDDMWFDKILPYFSNTQFRRCGEDKCYHGIWLGDAKRPVTLAMNIAGVFYNGEYEVITVSEAVDNCLYGGEFLIKPSVDSGEARLIEFYDSKKLTRSELEKIFADFGCNFIIQIPVKQHSDLNILNDSSLNTIRIVSFFFENEVHILSSILRIGGSGSRVDNIGAGGFACPVKEDGTLSARAVNRKSDWVTQTEKGVVFEGIKVPSYDKAVECVKKYHKRFAHFKIIGWDIGIDEQGEPVIIEYNTNPGQNQYSCGPTFGDLTEKVLEDVFIKKTLEKSRN